MSSLEVLVARNERAAAREEAHARLDGNPVLAGAIARANPITTSYASAYSAAVKEN